MLLSIIIPIYNVEGYLEQCIESVINEKFADFECILVNDGSTDKSGEICDFYSKLDNRIKVIHQENGGLSAARNTGIRVATGEYLYFLDGDDYLNEGAITYLASLLIDINSPDIVTGAFKLDFSGKIIDRDFDLLPLDTILKKEDFYNQISESKSIHWSASSNVYRKKIITDNNLRFREGLIGAEDCDFFMKFVSQSTKFMFTNYDFFYYRKNRKGSITTEMSVGAILGQLKVFSENFYYFKNENNEEMQIYFSEKFANAIYLIAELKNKIEIEKCLRFIQSKNEILKKLTKVKYFGAKVIWSVFGYYHGSSIMKKINSIVDNVDYIVE